MSSGGGGAGKGHQAVFVDRDGTLIVDHGYPRDPREVRLLPAAAAALRTVGAMGWAVVVVSNQSGIGRGIVTSEEARAVHERFLELLRQEGVRPDAVKYCPHAPDELCRCRKPAPGMLLDAATELDLDLAVSVMVGDKAADVEAGRRAGCARAILLRIPGAHAATADGAPGGSGGTRAEDAAQADVVARSWEDALSFLLRETAGR